MPGELKDWNVDVATSKPATIGNEPSMRFYRIFDPKQGTNPNQVIGRECLIESISIRGIFQYRPRNFLPYDNDISENLTDCYVRYIVFLDKQPIPEPEADLADDILEPNSYPITAFKNLDWSNRFDFLVDETFKLKPGKWFPMDKNIIGDENAVSGTMATDYNFYGRGTNLMTTLSTILLDDSKNPPVPYEIDGTINQVDTGTLTGIVNFDPNETTAGVTIPYDFKAGLGDPVPIATFRGNGNYEGTLEVVAMTGLWNMGVTPGTISTVPESTWFDGTMPVKGAAPLEDGTVSDMNFTTKVKLPRIRWTNETHFNLPRWVQPVPPNNQNPGFHGEMNTTASFEIAGRWTGSSELKSWWMKPKVVWQKDWFNNKITANDIKVCIIVDTPRAELDLDANVFTAYLSSRIRYRDN